MKQFFAQTGDASEKQRNRIEKDDEELQRVNAKLDTGVRDLPGYLFGDRLAKEIKKEREDDGREERGQSRIPRQKNDHQHRHQIRKSDAEGVDGDQNRDKSPVEFIGHTQNKLRCTRAFLCLDLETVFVKARERSLCHREITSE